MHMVQACKQFKYFEIILKSTLCGTVWYKYLLQIFDMDYLSPCTPTEFVYKYSVVTSTGISQLSTLGSGAVFIKMKMFVYENSYKITCSFMKIITRLENWQYGDSIIHIWLLIAQ